MNYPAPQGSTILQSNWSSNAPRGQGDQKTETETAMVTSLCLPKVDCRVTCESCREREEGLTGRADSIYQVGNPCKPSMGHSYYFAPWGKIALCTAKRVEL